MLFRAICNQLFSTKVPPQQHQTFKSSNVLINQQGMSHIALVICYLAVNNRIHVSDFKGTTGEPNLLTQRCWPLGGSIDLSLCDLFQNTQSCNKGKWYISISKPEINISAI